MKPLYNRPTKLIGIFEVLFQLTIIPAIFFMIMFGWKGYWKIWKISWQMFKDAPWY